MPRDCAPIEDGIVDLPGGRKGRLCASDAAGSFRIALQGSTWLDRLLDGGFITRDEHEAGQRLNQLFEKSSLRPGLTGSYLPVIDGHAQAFALERLDADQLRAWRRLGHLLAAVPPQCRISVENCALWDQPPANVKALQAGLAALARALRHPPRR
jgi:uncharacterized protein DUF6456